MHSQHRKVKSSDTPCNTTSNALIWVLAKIIAGFFDELSHPTRYHKVKGLTSASLKTFLGQLNGPAVRHIKQPGAINENKGKNSNFHKF